MKIENNGISSLSSLQSEMTTRVDKKDDRKDVQTVRDGQDKAVMSDNARLLSKARVALGNVEEPDNTRVATLKEQIANGNYSIRLNDLARKLVSRFYPK